MWRIFRRYWLPIRFLIIPRGSRRDRAYRAVRRRTDRAFLWTSSLFAPRPAPDANDRAHLQFLAEYATFQRQFEPSAAELSRQRADTAHGQGPVFSIVTAVFNPPWRLLRQTAASVRAQTYPAWRWHVVD